MKIEYLPGATPIDPNEAAGLKAKFIRTQSELNALEQENILEAHAWLVKKQKVDVLELKFLCALHRRMFANVWSWAGTFRRSDKNIGVGWHQIPTQLYQVLEDTRYWIANGTYPWDEIGVRFHHRLVAVHCFANGNGRHARLATDHLLAVHGIDPFRWGQGNAALLAASDAREAYIAALRKADARDYVPLLAFVK